MGFEKTKKLTLTWNSVNPGSSSNEDYGKFGYNVYFNGSLLDWTDKTSYTMETSNPYGTYKIIATYKSYTGVQSEASTYELKKPKEPEPEPVDPTTPDPVVPDPTTPEKE